MDAIVPFLLEVSCILLWLVGLLFLIGLALLLLAGFRQRERQSRKSL